MKHRENTRAMPPSGPYLPGVIPSTGRNVVPKVRFELTRDITPNGF